MYLGFFFLVFVSAWLMLSEAAVINATSGRLVKRQDPAIVALPSGAIEVPPPVDQPPTLDPSAQTTGEDVINGDATACGKKVQSEKPSDPAGEFLKCYMSGGL